MLKNKVTREKQLYRELFLKAQDGFFDQISSIKDKYKCNNCKKCLSLIYVNKQPSEIAELIDKGESKNEGPPLHWKAFSEYYRPCGFDNNIDWSNSELDLRENKIEALKINPGYVERVLKFVPDSIFYTSKGDPSDTDRIDNQFQKEYPSRVISVLHEGCSYLPWQIEVDHFIRTDLSQQIYRQINKIDAYREQFSCNRTGTCCNLSSSEFSYQELLDKAEAGDKFAKQFVSIFIPYESTEEAQKIFPDYVNFVLKEIGEGESVHFYHCPHIDEKNLCTIYNSDKRPQICAEFPSNPLTILYPHCGYVKWKQEVNTTAMMSHAMIEICTYTLDKLETIKEICGY